MINFVPKGWGFEKWIVNKEEYCGKVLFFVKGKKCSYHYHKLKDETFFVQSGKVELKFCPDAMFDNHLDLCKKYVLEKGDTFHIPRNARHQILALEDSEIIEFSTQHFDEDSYRVVRGD